MPIIIINDNIYFQNEIYGDNPQERNHYDRALNYLCKNQEIIVQTH